MSSLIYLLLPNINHTPFFLLTVVVLGVLAHAFELAGADELFDGAVEPLHLIDHILPDHESRAGRGATDHGPQFLVTIGHFF